MPLCLACETRFYHATMLDPAEPCDCGHHVTEQDTPEDISAARADWLQQQADEEGETACPRCGSLAWRYEGDRQICGECGR